MPMYASDDKDEISALLRRQSELVRLIEPAEERWLTLHETLDALAVD